MALLNKQNEVYKLLVKQMFSRCQQLQSENERSILRVNCIKKILRQRTYELELLKIRLDKHSDNWRIVSMAPSQTRGKPEQKRRGPKPKNKLSAIDLSSDNQQTIRKSRKERVKNKKGM